MPELKDLLGIIAGIVSVVSAWIAYKAKVREATAKSARRGLVIGIDDPITSVRPWKVNHVKWVVISCNLLVIILMIGLYIALDDFFMLALGGPAAISTVLALLTFRFLRTTPPSRVMKTARIVLGVGTAQALQHALAAVRATGTVVARLDPDALTIEGRIPMSFWKNPSLINARVRALSNERSEVEISSDAILPSVLFDFGINGRNVRRVVEHLLGAPGNA